MVRSWAEALEAINRDVEVMYVHDGPYQRAFDQVPKPDVVVEASADMVGKCGGVCANVIQAVMKTFKIQMKILASVIVI